MIYSRENVRQSLHGNTIFHLLLSHHHKEQMQDSELLFRPAELSWTSLSVHANILKFLWHFFRASDVTGISDEDCHVMHRLLLQYLPAAHDTSDANCDQGCVTLSPFELFWRYPKPTIRLGGQWRLLYPVPSGDWTWEDRTMVVGMNPQLICTDGAGEKQWFPSVGWIHLFS